MQLDSTAQGVKLPLFVLLIFHLQPLETWSVGNVIDWMAALHLYRYAELFRENKVTGRDLQTMDEDKLRVSICDCLFLCHSRERPSLQCR